MIQRIKILFIPFLLLLVTASNAQVFGGGTPTFDPVSWTASVEKVSDTEFVLHYEAEIEKDWHIYSQTTKAGMPFSYEFQNREERYTLKDSVNEGETETAYSEVFEEYETFLKGYNPKTTQRIILLDPTVSVIKSVITYQVCKEVCIQQDFYIVHDLKKKAGFVFRKYEPFENYVSEDANEKDEATTTTVDDDFEEDENKGLWTIFFLAFGGGLVALLTPCVFPMIPMTVGFFTKQSKSRAKGIRNAIFYGLSIILIYVVLGLTVVAIFGADALNALSTSVAFNLIFFVILVIFAISFFGAFEIQLPNSWANKVDRQADRGGLVGIFFMALALAIVSFSCTGPIVGTTLVQASSQGGIAPIIGMLGFSSAIAIPFALFAMFPAWMKSLPKSGGWLNSVKVILGFIELALAFKFLSNADLVLQAHFLERELFIAIIIAVMTGLAIYLFGGIKLPHDSEMHHISVGRLLLGLVTLTFVVYLIPGLWGAPLKLISGFPPPMNYSESPYGVGGGENGIMKGDEEFPDDAEVGPHDLLSFTDYEAGMEYAKKENKAVFLDFTGVACVNCRRMEELVWSDPKILNILRNDVVLISLYADKRDVLPKDEQYISETTGKRIKTVGNKWSDFQIKHYGLNAQPYYVLLDHDGKKLNKPVGYTPDIKIYEQWLKEGITRFNNN
ncbi:thiol:disulfide interchange protein [Dokdonia sinensis]|uniref:Thiol:disulfide interchange protein n=1 Tax=Dokdonia sinensis TaxID=2479847 RepID=A0A3M0FYG2_9FLAO|nr:cytochrome c biogenesis protein CcdA [Dokdonia sinensis]RMB56917.1 thiol:disulfide interchange protein [Dokdonia sinensis]